MTLEEIEAQQERLMADRILVILGSHVDFRSARRQAEAISQRSGIPFSMEGLVYDAKRGLILPDDSPDSLYAGSYLLRRYNTASLTPSAEPSEFISIERSEAYPGLAPGLYIIIGGIHHDTANARKSLARFKTASPDGYTKKTRIYMGCLH